MTSDTGATKYLFHTILCDLLSSHSVCQSRDIRAVSSQPRDIQNTHETCFWSPFFPLPSSSFSSGLYPSLVWMPPPLNPVQMSEFARTLVYNGQGTDHAWGGNYFLAGGSVRGGQILGNYPTRLDDESDINVRQGGRLLPTTPWEAVWHGLAEWFGVGATEMAGVLPNMANWPAGSMMTEKHLFTG